MSVYPLFFDLANAPRAIVALVGELMPRLLAGDGPVHNQLREQYRHCLIVRVELSGAGFFVDFDVPRQHGKVEPARLVGGDAYLELSDVPNGAGCVLFVEDGYLSMLEGYTYTGAWTVDTEVIEIRDVVALTVAA